MFPQATAAAGAPTPISKCCDIRKEALDVRGADWARRIATSMMSMAIFLDTTVRARADEPCARVETPTELSAAWAGAVVDLRRQIAQLPASDCLSLTLSLEPLQRGMRIVAMTRDRRTTARTVERSESLVGVALGLLMTIPGEPSPTPQVFFTPPASLSGGPRAGLPGTAPAIATGARKTALWAGLSGGIRLTAPTLLTVLDIEARADILFEDWFLLVTVQSALLSCLGQQGVDCDVYNDVSVGAGVGRRFPSGGPALDVAFEPSLVVMHLEYDGSSGGDAQTVRDTEVVLRLDVSARLAVPLDRHWFLTVTLDGGLAPSQLATPTRLELPVGAAPGVKAPLFPAWSGGVRLGASGALL